MMLYGKTRFNDLRESAEGINSKTPSLTISEMERDGLIKRHVHPGMPLRAEYKLTEKVEKLRLMLEQMGEFSSQYCAADTFRDKKPRTFEQALEMTGR